MNYRFIYSQSECSRVIPACLIDKRAAIPAISGQIGSVIKAYTDSQVALVTDTCVFYKIETDMGNLAGYFTLSVGGSAVVILQYELRPAFEQFSVVISGLIANFISNGTWQNDYLQ